MIWLPANICRSCVNENECRGCLHYQIVLSSPGGSPVWPFAEDLTTNCNHFSFPPFFLIFYIFNFEYPYFYRLIFKFNILFIVFVYVMLRYIFR